MEHLNVVLLAGAIALGLGYAVGQFRTGRIRGASESLQVANAELEIHRERSRRLEADVARFRTEVDRMHGMVEQLREENRELRALLMGEKVQPAMLEAMQAVAIGNREAYRLMLDEMFAPIRRRLDAALDRLAPEGGKAS